MINPRDRGELEYHLTILSYPPFDVEWADVAEVAMKAIDDGHPDEWVDMIVDGYQLTAADTLRFLGIYEAFQNLTVAESATTKQRKKKNAY